MSTGICGVPHAHLAHHQLHHVPFLVAGVGVHDGEAVHVVAKLALGDGDQRRRIDAARQREGDRHIGAQAQLDRAGQPLLRAGHGLLVGHVGGLGGEGRLPVRPFLHASGRVDAQPAAGTHALQAVEEGGGRLVESLVAVDEIALEVLLVDGQAPAHQGEQELDLGAEVELVAVAVDINRLFAKPVARQRQPVGLGIEPGEPPHALAAGKPLRPGLRQHLRQHLRVRGRSQLRARALHRRAQLEIVIELAVVGQHAAVDRRTAGWSADRDR